MHYLNLTIIGFNDQLLNNLESNGLKITRKGEIRNKRLGTRYTSNIIRIQQEILYEKGVEEALSIVMTKLYSNSILRQILAQSSESEIQVRLDWESEDIPAVFFSNTQLTKLAELGVDLDITIS